MASSKGERARGKRKTEVPGQALGYGLQYTRLTQLLLQAPPGSFCSMEYLDDVAEELPGNRVKLVQSKSALTANPVANRSKSLWKTLANWVELAASPGFNLADTVFEIYVSRAVGGKIVQSFADAKNVGQARQAIAEARAELWGEPPSWELKDSVSNEIAGYVETVFDAEAALLEGLLCRFQLTVGSGSPQADIEAIIRSHPVSPRKVAEIADHMCGVVKRRVDAFLEEQRPAIIGRDEFYGWYGAYLRKVDRDTVLLSRARAPSADEARGQMPKAFVQQLDIIGLSYEDKLEAVSDYLMAAADRTEWAVRGEVDASSFDELDGLLTRTWRNKRRTCGIQHAGKPEDLQGQALYSDCMALNLTVQAMAPPSHFIPGCLHRLSDHLTIGWHPSYQSRLKSKQAA